MNTILKFKHSNALSLPEAYQNDDVRFSDSLVTYFIEQFTSVGDYVFDPFAGFGTTLVIAEKLNRAGYGIELLPDRAEYIRSIITNKANIKCGSALNLLQHDLPAIDFSITSPPYMSRNNHEQYPFAAYQVTGEGYDQYLSDIEDIYKQLSKKLKPNAYAIIEISNIIKSNVLTTLAWDVARAVGKALTFEKEIVIEWESDKKTEKYGFGFDHSYCLVFKNDLQ
jgi:DNA modification methylase